MARIQTRKGKKRTTYTATIRVKGFPALARTFDTKGEAKIWAADVEKNMRMGRYQDIRPVEKLNVAEAIARYLDQVSVTKRPNSERRDKDSAKAIMNGFGCEISLSEITPQRLAAYRDIRMTKVSPSTIQKEFALLSHMFNVARREWGRTSNQYQYWRSLDQKFEIIEPAFSQRRRRRGYLIQPNQAKIRNCTPTYCS